MTVTKSMKNFTLYILIGAAAAVMDYGVFFLAENHIHGINPEFASVIGQAAGFLFSFFFNTFYNFKKTDKLFKRFLSFFTVCLIGMVISTIIIHLLKTSINVYILKAACLILVSVIQFILNKLFTYKN